MNDIENWSGFDLSAFAETVNNTVNAVRQLIIPVAEMIQNFQDFMRPMIETINALRPKINAMMDGAVALFHMMNAINKLGESQYVYWDYMSDEFIEYIVAEENTNKALRKWLVKGNFKIVKKTIEKCREAFLMKRYLRLFNQSVDAFFEGKTDISVIGLTSIIDGLLSDVSGNQTTRIATRVESIIARIEQNEYVSNDEYALLILVWTFQETMESFSASSDFSKKEPKGLNRHWIMHGRSKRRKTKLDCVKLINLIYAILLIDELGRKESDRIDE